MDTERQCGTCTACCVALEIIELNKPVGVACSYLKPSCDKPCGQYQARPQVCREYQCMWLLGVIPRWAKPNEVGLILGMVPMPEDETILRVIETRPGAAHTLQNVRMLASLDRNFVVFEAHQR